LRLYALYKQAATGDAPNDRPGLMDIVGKYKHDAWAALKGIAPETAKQEYIELVEMLTGATRSLNAPLETLGPQPLRHLSDA
jgi:diazepam-binding inhibitor (GABA receptor modulator, acyl-CoA-binding protein)